MAWFLRDLSNPRVPLFERWKFFKDNVKMSAIEWSSAIVYQTRMHENGLCENLNRSYLLDCDNPGVGARDNSTIKSQLTRLTEDRYHGAMVRARAERFLFGEQPTKRALASELMYVMSKEINSIQTGPILTSDKAIIACIFVNHYITLSGSLGTQSNPDKLRCLLFRMRKRIEPVLKHR